MWHAQTLFSGSEKRWWHASNLGSKTAEMSAGKARIQNDHSETDPRTHSAWGPLHCHGPERCLLSYQIAPHHSC